MKIPYERRKSLYGYGFIAIWIVGTIKWFLIPLITSLIYSFQNVTPEIGGPVSTWAGISNYKYAFMSDPNYRELLIQVLKETFETAPLIIVFSLFIAVILNQKFRGRTFARAVFFLPVIIATGPVYNIINGDLKTNGNSDASQFSTMFKTDLVKELLTFLGIYGISEDLTAQIESLTTNVFSLVWSSGIQILIFLAALQNIPPSAREAAQIEGATSWEYFWKIILPYVSPMILANLIFTIIDSFTSPTNAVMTRVLEVQNDWQYGLAAAMAWTYFAIVLAAIGLVTMIINHFIYYEVE